MIEITVPKLNNNDAHYDLVEWLAEDGATVAKDDDLATVETSKAAEDLVSEHDGVLLQVVPAGKQVAPGTVVGRLFADAARREAFLAAASSAATAGPRSPDEGGAVILTDAARRLASEHAVTDEELHALGRRVVKGTDVEALLARRGSAGGTAAGGTTATATATGHGTPAVQATPTPATRVQGPDMDSTEGDPNRVELSTHQRAIATVVSESLRTIPTSFTVLRIRVDAAEARAAELTRETEAAIGLPELLISELAGLREKFPAFFSTYHEDGTISLADASHIGVTVDVGNGLYIPVVRDAEGLSVAEVADLLEDFRFSALRGSFRGSDLAGAAITLSLNNDEDVLLTQPIVFPGQTCMLSLGGTQDVVRLTADGAAMTIRQVHLGLAFDHRVVNGREAVLFLRALKSALEAGHDREPAV
ncbi:2-oxo acid dehydrogenase subunit E2 [Streptomyces sp. cg36]|uniref:2-oxo acid dehydrogenase subunit E2 n=1 Tax=Streptomyces sp. cg36 TaxID=3238798 RepID=UPI0034E21490